MIGVVLHFDNATGVYSIDLTATAANPFAGSFRINMNWLNIDAAVADQFFSDSANDFTLGAPTTLLTLTGTNSALLGWAAGNRVAVNNAPFGNPTVPTGIFAFRSQVIDSTFTVFDNLGVGTGPSTADFGVVTSAVPEPATLLLFGTGLAALAVRRRLRG